MTLIFMRLVYVGWGQVGAGTVRLFWKRRKSARKLRALAVVIGGPLHLSSGQVAEADTKIKTE